jgi:hypothetical protein
MRPLQLPPLTPMPTKARDHLYRTTKPPRRRTRAQMIRLAVEQGLTVHQIAAMVHEREATVLRWLKRYRAAGLHGLHAAPRPLGLPCSPLCADAPGVWGYPSPSGRANVSSLTWPRKRRFGSRMRPSGAP